MKLIEIIVGATIVIAPAIAIAQSADEGVIEEIVVTAQKVASSEQKTPISMEVYTGKDLADRGVVDLKNLAANDPSLIFATSTNEPYIAMRGVSTGNVTETGNPSVAVATDGVFLNRSYSLNSTLYDIDRIEVLRGPQGTLYGRNAVGGVVSIVTNKPTDDFGANVSVDIGNYRQENAQAAVNLPINDWMAVRVAAASYYHDGYRNNAPNLRDGDDQDSRSARAQILIHPTEQFSALIGYTETTIDEAGGATLLLPFNPSNPNHNAPAISNPFAWPVDAPQYEKSNTKDWHWDISYAGLPGRTTVDFLGGWNEIAWHHASPQLADPGEGNVPGGIDANTSYFQNEYPKTTSYELRFSSPTDQLVAWQTGLYYFSEKSSLHSIFIDNYNSPNENDDIITFNFPKVDSSSKAAFGQLSYNATDTLKFTAGARYTKDTIVRDGTFDLYLNVGPDGTVPIHVTPNVDGYADSSKVTWLVDADWSITNQNMVYAKVSTGYKAGGFTGAGSYKPESLTAYETGSKNRFNDGKLQLNGAVYWMNYTDQQLNQFSDPIAGAQTVNANSRIYGFEGNLIALVGPGGRLVLSTNYLNARITEFTPPAGYNPAISASIVGDDVPLSPRFSGSLEFDQSFGALAGTFTGRGQLTYESGKFFSANNFADTYAGANAIGNLSLEYKRPGSRWTVQGYVRNLTNRVVLVDAEEVYNANFKEYSFGPPRTFGVRISANF